MAAVSYSDCSAPTPSSSTSTSATLTLDQLPLNVWAEVLEIVAPSHTPEWQDWLEDIGFLPGERVQLLTRARPGGDPLVVRVGGSTFALRRAEAACISVEQSV